MRRFDHHRPARDGRPARDREHGIWYGAPDLTGCLVEVFGDTGVIDPGDRLVATVKATRELVLLDLTGPGAMRAGSVAALSKHAEAGLTQAWSRWFYEHPDVYGEIDGLLYLNAHNDDRAVALYERAAPALFCPSDGVVRLDDASLRPVVFAAAASNNLDVVPY